MTTINDIVHLDRKPDRYHALYPFAVTLHVPGRHPLNAAEMAAINDALVHAACKIRLMRGHGECNFAWCDSEGRIDWEREGFPALANAMMSQPADNAKPEAGPSADCDT